MQNQGDYNFKFIFNDIFFRETIECLGLDGKEIIVEEDENEEQHLENEETKETEESKEEDNNNDDTIPSSETTTTTEEQQKEQQKAEEGKKDEQLPNPDAEPELPEKIDPTLSLPLVKITAAHKREIIRQERETKLIEMLSSHLTSVTGEVFFLIFIF